MMYGRREGEELVAANERFEVLSFQNTVSTVNAVRASIYCAPVYGGTALKWSSDLHYRFLRDSAVRWTRI